jgi:hypothetical protein
LKTNQAAAHYSDRKMAPTNGAIYKLIVAVVTFDDDRSVAAMVMVATPTVMSMPAVVVMIVHPMPFNNDCFGAGHCRYS